MASLQLGEEADEADWRALVEKGLKGASWDKLAGRTADGVELKPLYRESDFHSAEDVSGFAGAAPFVRGARLGPWLIRQAFEHPDPEQTNREILADLAGGVSAIELRIDPEGETGLHMRDAAALDRALADMILEAAPVSLDAGEHGAWAAELLAAKLKGVAAPGTAFNIDPIGALMRSGAAQYDDIGRAARFAVRVRQDMPAATALRVDARPVHEAGGTEAQEIAAALASGIAYLRALTEAGLRADDAAQSLLFTLSIGPDVLIEAAKLRALRLCWARVLEASGAAPEARAAHIHAFTSKRMMTRVDAHTNILRVTCAAFAAALGGADAISTAPFTDALGLPTPFARRVARNTQLVLMEEAHLHHVADPAGGAWFVEKLTRDLAEKAWTLMQEVEAKGGIAASLEAGHLQAKVAAARATRQAAFARRKETIAGVTDFPLLGQKRPELSSPAGGGGRKRSEREGVSAANAGAGPLSHRAERADSSPARGGAKLPPVRWAEPFETLRERAEGKSKGVFFANLGALEEFAPRAAFAQNLLAVGGVAAIGAETEHASVEALIAAFKASNASVAMIIGADSAYADHAADTARALKAAGAVWVMLAGKPSEREAALREAGVDQFVFVGIDVLKELDTLHGALGISPQ